jgi:hypothetical protein
LAKAEPNILEKCFHRHERVLHYVDATTGHFGFRKFPDIDRPPTFAKRRTAAVPDPSNFFLECEAAAFRVVGRTATARVGRLRVDETRITLSDHRP